MFSVLFGFGVLNAILGPALPYLRAEEHLYLTGALHQLAFAVGGGLSRSRRAARCSLSGELHDASFALESARPRVADRSLPAASRQKRSVCWVIASGSLL